MLHELRIRNLGVIDDVTLVMREGMTAVTGETGAGKTMLVEAIRLLSGSKADVRAVRSGTDEASIEGRFGDGDEEIILTRIVPVEGRSRAYVNGTMANSAGLAEAAAGLVELHAQHGHQSLLTAGAQRDALDTFGAIDTGPLREASRAVGVAKSNLDELGGDITSRTREIDLLSYQLEEIDRAQLDNPNETESLGEQADALADVAAHREAAELIHANLAGDAAAGELVARALAAANTRGPLHEFAERLAVVSSELNDLAVEISAKTTQLVDDPETLAETQARRHMLRGLEKKYGPTLGDVIDFANRARARLDQLRSHDESLAGAQAGLESARTRLREEQERIFEQRTGAAPKLAKAVEERLKNLALPNARFSVQVDDQDVVYLLSTNPGLPELPIAKAASGGELSRTMLALHLALLGDTSTGNRQTEKNQAGTLIFDEVDAGVGGQAAVSIGQALSDLARGGYQVLVVTHLPQVAAYADNQLSVSKNSTQDSTTTSVIELRDDDREIELARMLAGHPDSRSGRAHARELMNKSPGRSPAEAPDRSKAK